jgi:uncharacterized repeat protein (TIGR01451 family)
MVKMLGFLAGCLVSVASCGGVAAAVSPAPHPVGAPPVAPASAGLRLVGPAGAVLPNDDPPPASADLSLTEGAPASVPAGLDVNWTFTVADAGPSGVDDAVVSDTLPAGLTFVGASPAVCSASGPTLTCALGTVATGSDVGLTITTAVAAGLAAGTVLSNTGQVSSASTTDPDPSNNTATATAPPSVVPVDLSITETGPASLVPGSTATWNVTVVNHGPGVADGVTVLDGLAPGLAYVSGDPASCSASGSLVSCALGSLGPGGVMSFALTVLVAPDVPAGAIIGNSVSVRADEPDLDPSDNDYGPVRAPPAQPEADLAVSERAPPSPVRPGAPVTWTVTVKNRGPSDAQAVRVADALPSALAFVVSDPAGCSVSGRALTCPLGTLAAQSTVALALTTTVSTSAPGGSAVRNGVSVTSETPDPATGNDSATASTSVAGSGPSTSPGTGTSPPSGSTGSATGASSGTVDAVSTDPGSGAVPPATEAAGSTLAFTGMDVGALVIPALVLSGAGGVLALITRRRRSTPRSDWAVLRRSP